jgi:hypothetical protein
MRFCSRVVYVVNVGWRVHCLHWVAVVLVVFFAFHALVSVGPHSFSSDLYCREQFLLILGCLLFWRVMYGVRFKKISQKIDDLDPFLPQLYHLLSHFDWPCTLALTLDVIILKCALKPSSTVTLHRGKRAASIDTHLGISAVVPADPECHSLHYRKPAGRKGDPVHVEH